MNDYPALAWLEKNEPASLERLCDWLRIPSVSTDPAYAGECRRAAEWAAQRLREAGLVAVIEETGDLGPDGKGSGRPIVMGYTPGERPGSPSRVMTTASASGVGPHVLFYGHYDVQPADPVELWHSGPFEPVIREAEAGEAGGRRVVARGACDDKGQVMMFLEALRAAYETTGKPAGGARFTVLLEGEEESGSANLERFLREKAGQFTACDFCLISDTGMLDRDHPAITYGVRGLTYTEVILHAADQDLHSGSWGGKCPNPNNELVKVLAQLWDEQRRVTIPGFYDAVRPIADAERAAWAALKVDTAAALQRIGLPPEADVGEAGYTALEREWGRPTCDINGLFGGYSGKGAKTVIPSYAGAKVSFRLVADQDPHAICESFFAWLNERTPVGCRWELIDHSGGHPATVSTDSPYLTAVNEAVEAATGVRPALIKTGGSIPVAGMLKAIAGLDTIFMGFGLGDDRVHSPNEKFEIECFRKGARSHALLLEQLVAMQPERLA